MGSSRMGIVLFLVGVSVSHTLVLAQSSQPVNSNEPKGTRALLAVQKNGTANERLSLQFAPNNERESVDSISIRDADMDILTSFNIGPPHRRPQSRGMFITLKLEFSGLPGITSFLVVVKTSTGSQYALRATYEIIGIALFAKKRRRDGTIHMLTGPRASSIAIPIDGDVSQFEARVFSGRAKVDGRSIHFKTSSPTIHWDPTCERNMPLSNQVKEDCSLSFVNNFTFLQVRSLQHDSTSDVPLPIVITWNGIGRELKQFGDFPDPQVTLQISEVTLTGEDGIFGMTFLWTGVGIAVLGLLAILIFLVVQRNRPNMSECDSRSAKSPIRIKGHQQDSMRSVHSYASYKIDLEYDDHCSDSKASREGHEGVVQKADIDGPGEYELSKETEHPQRFIRNFFRRLTRRKAGICCSNRKAKPSDITQESIDPEDSLQETLSSKTPSSEKYNDNSDTVPGNVLALPGEYQGSEAAAGNSKRSKIFREERIPITPDEQSISYALKGANNNENVAFSRKSNEPSLHKNVDVLLNTSRHSSLEAAGSSSAHSRSVSGNRAVGQCSKERERRTPYSNTTSEESICKSPEGRTESYSSPSSKPLHPSVERSSRFINANMPRLTTTDPRNERSLGEVFIVPDASTSSEAGTSSFLSQSCLSQTSTNFQNMEVRDMVMATEAVPLDVLGSDLKDIKSFESSALRGSSIELPRTKEPVENSKTSYINDVGQLPALPQGKRLPLPPRSLRIFSILNFFRPNHQSPRSNPSRDDEDFEDVHSVSESQSTEDPWSFWSSAPSTLIESVTSSSTVIFAGSRLTDRSYVFDPLELQPGQGDN